MKKRRKGLCILLAIMLLVSGCGKETKKEEATLINSAPLNIIDDNYRNYYEVFVYSFCDGDGDGIHQKIEQRQHGPDYKEMNTEKSPFIDHGQLIQ